MITKENFHKVLENLGFTKNEELNKYYKSYEIGTNTYDMAVDFQSGKLEYDEEIIAGRDTTKDFHQNENFVVFECVCRLLERGYEPKNIILEATSGVAGRGQTQTYLDILVKDNDGNNYLIIECKTAGKEFDDAWAKVKKNGGQLFNYWTLFGTKHMCLYASDYSSEINKLSYSSNVIIFEKEDQIRNQEEKQKKLTHIETLLKTNPLTKGYKDLDENANQNDYFNVWTETYGQPELYHGIFEEGCKPYEISEKITLSYNDLKEMEDYEEIQKKYHQFATIMRQHNVGSHENSFDKLVNLFLAKIVDETDNQKELKFNWKGAAFDDYYNFQDRLQQMYSKGMSEFLGEKVEYVSDEQIDNAFKFFAKDTPELSRDEVKKLFHIQKFFTNNDFSFLDVHNEQLFMQNVTILIKVVQMLQGMKLKTKTENQFLGDLFEGFLDQGVKQSEGQFFTPTPIVKFLVSSLPISKIVAQNSDAPKVIDYACGAGHFLNEVARVVKTEAEEQEKNYEAKDIYGNIVGIEKEYRLSKVAKVSSFMYGQDEIQIVYGDGLIPHKNVENGTFNILVANPPYSVKGFLETLDNNQKSSFSLYTNKAKSIVESTTNTIETFFVERAAQLLAVGGVAAIILPSTILSNEKNYTDCRKIILQNFNIIAIAEFGGGTFGKTTTSTVTLFLEKKPFGKLASEWNVSDEAVQYKNRVNAWFSGDFSKSEFFEDGHFFEEYCNLIETDFKEYQSWILGGDLPKSELFTEYDKKAKNELKKLCNRKITSKYTQQEKEREIKQKTFDFIAETEKEKLYYYILSRLNRTKVLVAKSPSDNKVIKTYLGYEWSSAKGNEGIKYLGQNVTDEDDAISKNSGIFGIKTPLFNPADKNDETKICFAIRKNFENTSSVSRICNGVALTDGSSLVAYNLSDMIDFSRASFDMQIRINVKQKINFKKELKLIKLNEVCKIIKGVNYDKEEESIEETNNIVLTADNVSLNGDFKINKKIYVVNSKIFDNEKKLKKNDLFMCFSSGSLKHIGKVAYITNNTEYYAGGFMGILRSELVDSYYLYNFLNQDYMRYELQNEATGSNIKNLSNSIGEIKIPLPPKEVQSRVVAECKKLDDEVANLRLKQSKLKEKIEEIMNNVHGDRKKLGEICKQNEFSCHPEKNPDSEYIYIDIESVDNGTGKFSIENRIFGKEAPSRARRYAKAKSTLVSTVRPYLKGFAFIEDEIKNAVYSTGFAILQSANDKILLDKMIYYNFMFNRDLMNQMISSMPKGQYPSINRDDINNFKISLPSLSEQEQIVSQIETIESQIADLQKKIDVVPSLKKAILDKELLAE